MKDNRKRFLLRCAAALPAAPKVSKKICAVGSAVQSLKKTMNHWETWRPCPANFPNVSWKEILQEIRCLMHNAMARRYLFLLVYLALSWSWKNRSELEIHAERLEENDSCDDGMSLTLEEKLHKRPLTAVLHYYTVSWNFQTCFLPCPEPPLSFTLHTAAKV